jgi:hypothetical protein
MLGENVGAYCDNQTKHINFRMLLRENARFLKAVVGV